MICSVENGSARDKSGSRSQVQGHCNNSGKSQQLETRARGAVVEEVVGCSVGPKEDWTVEGR